MLNRAVLIVVCLAFLAIRAVGVHSHISHAELDDLANHAEAIHSHAHPHGHEERITVPQVEGTVSHFNSHVQDGDVDVDSTVVASAKTPLAKVVFALIGLVCSVLLGACSAAIVQRLPPRPPPGSPRRFQLLPPSHAPPSLA